MPLSPVGGVSGGGGDADAVSNGPRNFSELFSGKPGEFRVGEVRGNEPSPINNEPTEDTMSKQPINTITLDAFIALQDALDNGERNLAVLTKLTWEANGSREGSLSHIVKGFVRPALEAAKAQDAAA